MSNVLKKYTKNAKENVLKYPIEMYDTPHGSIVICGLMFTPFDEQPQPKEIRAKWKKYISQEKKGKEIFPKMSDKKFIKKMLELFGLDVPDFFPIAMIQSDIGCLFAPYLKKQVYPLREDMMMGYTLRNGKVYPISFDMGEKEENKLTNKLNKKLERSKKKNDKLQSK